MTVASKNNSSFYWIHVIVPILFLAAFLVGFIHCASKRENPQDLQGPACQIVRKLLFPVFPSNYLPDRFEIVDRQGRGLGARNTETLLGIFLNAGIWAATGLALGYIVEHFTKCRRTPHA